MQAAGAASDLRTNTSSEKPPIEMIIGDWYLDDLGNPTREIKRRE